ncbi:MAG: hypothetical protein MAG451_03247 [Anaerolineales bacterium]|nr:hypothetical protein [Anaerolineales bacterium]
MLYYCQKATTQVTTLTVEKCGKMGSVGAAAPHTPIFSGLFLCRHEVPE